MTALKKFHNPQQNLGKTQEPTGTAMTEHHLVLENSHGQAVRYFRFDGSKIFVIYRHDNRRIEAVSSLEDLRIEDVEFELVGETTTAALMKNPLDVAGHGRLRYAEEIRSLSPNHELRPENTLEPKKAFGASFGLQVLVLMMVALGSFLTGPDAEPEHTVTVLDKEDVERLMKQIENRPEEPRRRAETPPPPPPRAQKKIVVNAAEKKITKRDPIPTRSATRNSGKKLRGGGYKASNTRRGNGTNEQNMNSIGALGALNKGRGNGGRGGLNLQAVGHDDGSGAGGQGRGGYGRNGSGGKGLGGLGTGRGQGLANSMYGKGLVAAPFGDGSPAPGSGGYGTRGKAGGGARGAGYGSETVVGSWKGTGPKGDGAAGSGAGNGDAYGSPHGVADGDSDSVDVSGGLSRDQIAAVINRYLGQITYCYEQGLQKSPNLAGRVAVRFQIGASGRVETARVNYTSVRSAKVENCIVSKLKTWPFPRPRGGVTVAVTYPFVLRRVSQR